MSSFFSFNKKTLLLGLSVLLFSSSEAKPNSFLRNLGSDSDPGCWIESYGRGVGKPITVCPDGLEKNGALCYPPCKDGFTGVGPVCWQNCPGGFTDTGADCLKPGSYGRGAGYAIWDGNKCASDNSQGCEQWGALWYPKCAENFHNVACCVCSPNCPGDMTDIGVSCQKQSYGRGAGVPLVCPSDKDEDAALCYDKCKSGGYDGVGPVCWGQCPAGKYKCGALCLESEDACTSDMLNIAGKVLQGMIEFASELEDPVEAAITIAETGVDVGEDLAKYPICSNM